MFGVAPLGLHDDVQGAALLRCNLQCSHFKPTFPPTRRNSSLWLLKLQLNDYMVSLTRHNWIYFTPFFSSVLWILSSFCLMGGKQLTAVLVSFNRRWHCQQHHQLFTVFHPTDFALLILRGEISFLHILRNNMGCAELLTLKEIRLVTCCTSFFFCEGVNWHRLREVPEGMAAKHAGFGFSMWCSTGKDQRLHFEKKT